MFKLIFNKGSWQLTTFLKLLNSKCFKYRLFAFRVAVRLKSLLHQGLLEQELYFDLVQCFSLLFGKCVNWSIDKTIYFSCHYIQSNDSLTALDANNSWLPHYHTYMNCFFKCTGKCTYIEGFLISLIQIIQVCFCICTFDFSTKMSIFIGSNVNLVSAISWYLYFVVKQRRGSVNMSE